MNKVSQCPKLHSVKDGKIPYNILTHKFIITIHSIHTYTPTYLNCKTTLSYTNINMHRLHIYSCINTHTVGHSHLHNGIQHIRYCKLPRDLKLYESSMLAALNVGIKLESVFTIKFTTNIHKHKKK